MINPIRQVGLILRISNGQSSLALVSGTRQLAIFLRVLNDHTLNNVGDVLAAIDCRFQFFIDFLPL